MEYTKLLLLLSFLCCVFKLKEVSAFHCTEYNVKKCMRPIDDYLEKKKLENPQHKELQLFHLNEPDLREYCHIYETQTSTCLQGLIGHCTYADKKAFQGIEDSSDYLCKEALEEYIRHKSCIGSKSVQDKLKACAAESDRKINGIDETLPYSSLRTKICRLADETVKCDVKAGSTCGPEAQEWIKEYETRYLDPIMEQFDCQEDDVPLVRVIVPVVTIIGFVLIPAIICVAIYCCHKKKSVRNSTEPVVFSNVLRSGFAATPYHPPNNNIAEKSSAPPPDYSHVNHPATVVSPPPSYISNDGMSTYESNMGRTETPPQYTTLQSSSAGAAPATSISSQSTSMARSSLHESNPVYIDPTEQRNNMVPERGSVLSQESSPDYSYAYATPT